MIYREAGQFKTSYNSDQGLAANNPGSFFRDCSFGGSLLSDTVLSK